MAEKELRQDLQETVNELLNVKAELARRISPVKEWAKTAMLVLLVLIGAKIALKLLRYFLGVVWGNLVMIGVILLIVLYKKQVFMQK